MICWKADRVWSAMGFSVFKKTQLAFVSVVIQNVIRSPSFHRSGISSTFATKPNENTEEEEVFFYKTETGSRQFNADESLPCQICRVWVTVSDKCTCGSSSSCFCPSIKVSTGWIFGPLLVWVIFERLVWGPFLFNCGALPPPCG